MAAGTGDTASKYVARRETPLFIAENCTQCMECIAVCPDTALPNCSEDMEPFCTPRSRTTSGTRASAEDVAFAARDREAHASNDAGCHREKFGKPLPQILRQVTNEVDGFSSEAKRQFFAIIDQVPMAYQKVNAIFSTPERKKPGRWRNLLDLRLRPVQRMRRVCHCMR